MVSTFTVKGGGGYNELADALARLTGMGLLPSMEYMPFASLLFDSSALAWAWTCNDRPADLPNILGVHALRVGEVSSEGYRVQEVVGVQTMLDEAPVQALDNYKSGVANVRTLQGN
eukprot:3187469-Pyramimonas_sp.AAC.1